MVKRSVLPIIFILLWIQAFSGLTVAFGFDVIDHGYWTETAVRKVLHVFAYGGYASDEQIAHWSEMEPQDAVEEMLTFDVVNDKLSPVQDVTASYGSSLEELQSFWSSDAPENPTRPDQKTTFSVVTIKGNGDAVLSDNNLQNTWIAAVNKRGLNPFRNKVGFWLTNYRMAVHLRNVNPPLIRDLYDSIMGALEIGDPFQEILAIGATSAAVAMQYGHRNNRYINTNGKFYGNDDFAREYHQLFFGILGLGEDPDYHENVTIEHTAWALTGMQLDKEPGAYGSDLDDDWWLAPIVFTDHIDATLRTINNLTDHHTGDLEILRATIAGTTAEEKIFNLSEAAILHSESLDSIPVAIIRFFADDNLNAEKMTAIRAAWGAMTPKNLLTFLQAYSISTTFHRSDTFKYRTAFNRNLILKNLNTVNNQESYANSYSPKYTMQLQGAEVFRPAHFVFGGQTSLDAANNPSIFKEVYNGTVDSPDRIAKTYENYIDQYGAAQTWEKDWESLIPADNSGTYRADNVGTWLWKRFVSDNLVNYGPLERAHINCFLATGMDLGYVIDPGNPDVVYSVEELEAEPLKSLLETHADAGIELNSSDTAARRTANRRVGLAISFISATPFMFASEAIDACKGDLDADGMVNSSDLARISKEFGQMNIRDGWNGDFNGDGDIDGADLAEFNSVIGNQGCP